MKKKMILLGLVLSMLVVFPQCSSLKSKLVLATFNKMFTTYNAPMIRGTVKNEGSKSVCNVKVAFTARNASNTIVDTANGFPADLGDIPGKTEASFDAIFFDMDDWQQATKITYQISWITADNKVVEGDEEELK